MNYMDFKSHARFMFPRAPVRISNESTELPPTISKFITKHLGPSKIFLEFGSGGSTSIAYSSGAKVYSVESDPLYVAAVKKLPHIVSVRINLGIVGPYGAPIFHPIRKPRRRWGYDYSNLVWDLFPDLSPDVVLIDGRYRVACALNVILRSKNRELLLLIDDYVGRDEYHIINNFAKLVDILEDRLAIFRINAEILELNGIERILDDAYLDLR